MQTSILRVFRFATGICITMTLPLAAQEPGRSSGGPGGGGGMGGFQEAIHKLFVYHAKVKRTVEMTGTGYKSRTVSDDPKIAKTLQKHVKEMRERLGAGMMIRRWDPAFAELVEHYKEIEHDFKEAPGGVEMIAKGKWSDAIKVVQNHARIVSGFVEKGPAQMHKSHPAVLDKAKPATPAEAGPKIVAESFAKLSVALAEAIAKGGPENALAVCSEKAMPLTATMGEAHGVTVRRATEKPRNPKKAADAVEMEVLAAFSAALAKGEAPKPQTSAHADGSTSFFAPIVLGNALCLQCHGSPEKDLAPATSEAIRKLY